MDTQASTHQPRQRWSLRSSFLLKQTAFVALMTIIPVGMLILATGTIARRIVRYEIDERVLIAATDRQALVLYYIRQQHELAAPVVSRTRPRQLNGEFA